MIKYVIIYVVSVFISSISQILLKISANTEYKDKLHEYLNPKVIVAYGIFFLATLVTVFAYKGLPLSLGPILETTGYVFISILSRVILKEDINARKLLGLFVVVIGIIVSCL